MICPLCLSAFRQHYSFQHMMIKLGGGGGGGGGFNLMDLFKAFDCLPYDIFIAKSEAYGFDKYLEGYCSIPNWTQTVSQN